MTSYVLRLRVRDATMSTSDAIGQAEFGVVEPGVAPREVHLRLRLREDTER